MQIEIHSIMSIEKRSHKPFLPHTALISIGNFGSEPPVLKYKPQHILRLTFDDIAVTEIDYENCGSYAFHLFSQEQAKQIADFVYRHQEDTTVWICQCHFGMSRSAAIAAAIKEHFEHNGIDIFADEQGRYCPNVYVFRETLQALNERRAANQNEREHALNEA